MEQKAPILNGERNQHRPTQVRWLMMWLAFGIAAVSYLDRSNISIAAVYLRRDLGLSDVQLGMVFSAFVLGYAFTQPVAGRLADRFGAYKTTGVGILWWSVLTALIAVIPTAFAGAFVLLLALRFVLGVGEAVIFPASNRLVANWIPSKERGLANGLIFAGVGVGAGIAPPLITTVMLAQSWRSAFWVSAVIGLVAFVVWMLLARDHPENHRRVNSAELEHIQAGRPIHSAAEAKVVPWRVILRSRAVALLALSYFCFGYVAYIFFSWFFIYLSKVRGLDLKSSGLYGMLPFIAMAVASPLGGWISDAAEVRFGQRIGRCVIAALGMGFAAVFVALATRVSDARLASVVLAGGSGALYLAQSAFWTLSANLGRSSAASVAGVMNMACQIGGAVVASLTPVLAANFGWSTSLLFAAAVSLVGAVAWLFIDPHASLSRARVETASPLDEAEAPPKSSRSDGRTRHMRRAFLIFAAAPLIMAPMGREVAYATPTGTAEHLSSTELRDMVKKTTGGLVTQPATKDPASRTLVVRRDKSGEVEVHDTMNDVMVAQAGHASIILGGRAEGGKPSTPNEWRGGSIVGGRTYTLGPGDVLWIPAGVPHQMLLKPGSSFSYLVVKSNKAAP